MARLVEAEAESAIAAVARMYAVSTETACAKPAAEPHEREGPGPGGSTVDEAPTDPRSAAVERLVATVPEALAPLLRQPQRRLLALTLALSRAPSWARSPQFATALSEIDRVVLSAGAHAPEMPVASPQSAEHPRAEAVAADLHRDGVLVRVHRRLDLVQIEAAITAT